MKSKIAIALILISQHAMCAGVKTLDELKNSVAKAIESKDVNLIESLTYIDGMSDADKKNHFASFSIGLFSAPAAKIETEDLTSDVIKPFHIFRGLKLTPTAPPIGLLVIIRNADDRSSKIKTAYTKVDGLFYLAAAKSEKLNWEGAPDKTIGWTLSVKEEKVERVDFTYNASGVDIDDSADASENTGLSYATHGQYIKEVTITSKNDNFEGSISITEDGKEISRSDTFRGKGAFTYKNNKLK